MNNTSTLRKVIESIIMPHGYQPVAGRKGLWAKGKNGILLIVGLRKSAYGGQHYLDLAVFAGIDRAEDLTKEHFAKLHFSHIMIGLYTIDPEMGNEPSFLNLDDTTWSSAERHKAIHMALERKVLPYLEKFDSIQDARGPVESYKLPTTIEGRKALGME